MSAEEYHHLLYKKMLEGLSAVEEQQLKAWLSASEEHRRAAAPHVDGAGVPARGLGPPQFQLPSVARCYSQTPT